MYLFFIRRLVLMILMGENPLIKPGIQLFWAQMTLASLVAISGPKKVLICLKLG